VALRSESNVDVQRERRSATERGTKKKYNNNNNNMKQIHKIKYIRTK
jgi:hypothetical protein